jgi:hypothetical protein
VGTSVDSERVEVELTPFRGHLISTVRKESIDAKNETAILARVPGADRRLGACGSHA